MAQGLSSGVPDRDAALLAAECGDANALAKLEAALATQPHDGALLIESADLRAATGDAKGCDRLVEILRRAPDWIDGHAALARIRWEMGDSDHFADELVRAIKLQPGHAGLWNQHIDLLAGVGRYTDAADTARAARMRGFTDPTLMVIEASNAGHAGDNARADALFAALPVDWSASALAEARHRLRTGHVARATSLLDRIRNTPEPDVAIWALTEICWRLTGDRRLDWLHQGGRLVRSIDLGIAPAKLADVAEALRRLHKARAQPIGQSVRNGTQTRGNLAKHGDPVLREFIARLAQAVETYRTALPPRDPGASVAGAPRSTGGDRPRLVDPDLGARLPCEPHPSGGQDQLGLLHRRAPGSGGE